MVIEQDKRYSHSEFQAFSELPENRDHLFELIRGKIVRKQSTFISSRLAVRVGYFIGSFADEIGYVTGSDGTYILSDEDEFMPDVGYISKLSLPIEPEREVLGPPDLAVEVKSPSDTKRQLRLKAEDYLRFGTKLVWLIFPEEQLAEVYMPDQDVVTVLIDDVLDGGTVLPGFTLPLRDIFI